MIFIDLYWQTAGIATTQALFEAEQRRETAIDPLTFPLVERQVGVIHGLIVQQSFGLFLCIPEVAEERQGQSLRGAHPPLRVQKQHLLQHAHC